MRAIMILGLWICSLTMCFPEGNTKGLIGYWAFDEGKGNIAKNLLGDKNNGKIVGAEWVEGRKGEALKFNGKNAYVEIPSSGIEDVTDGSFSFEAWAKPLDVPSGATMELELSAIIARPGLHTGIFYTCYKEFRFGVYNTEPKNFSVTSKRTFDPGFWYHIVGVLDKSANKIYLYVNGKLEGSADFAGRPYRYGNVSYFVGSANPFHPEDLSTWPCMFNGIIDEVKIYNSALSAEEVREIYFNSLSEKEREQMRKTKPEVVYDNLFSLPTSQKYSMGKPALKLSTEDGLSLLLSKEGQIYEIGAKAKVIGKKGEYTTGFFLRDARSSSIFPISQKITKIAEGKYKGSAILKNASLLFEAIYEAEPGFIRIKGNIKDISGMDRAITLYFSIPVDAIGWYWWDDIQSKRRIESEGEYINMERIPFGANGEHSRYPLCTVSSEDKGIAMAIPMDKPVVHRLAYNFSAHQLFIALDFALVKDTVKFPSRADFEFIIYLPDEPNWGFRSALAKYYSIYPHFFTKRANKEGGWYVWGNMKETPEAKEAGFMFHWGPAGVEAIKYDNENGFYPLQYIEFHVYHLTFEDFQSAPTYGQVMERLTRLARGEKEVLDAMDKLAFPVFEGSLEKMLGHMCSHYFGQMPRREFNEKIAKAVLASIPYDENGNAICPIIFKAPWVPDSGLEGLFTPNPDPEIPGGYGEFDFKYCLEPAFEAARKNNVKFAGIGLDSFGGYGADKRMNFNRNHFLFADFPLSFSLKGNPGIPLYFSIIEWTRELATKVHPQGLLLMANCAWHFTPAFLTFAAPYLDVFGAEAPYFSDLRFIRSIAYHKSCTDLPYTPRPEWEVKFHLLYGIFPGHGNNLTFLKKYNPLLQTLTQAGWEPITYARADREGICVERFGKGDIVYFSLHNPDDKEQIFNLLIEKEKLGLSKVKASDLLTGEVLPVESNGKNLKIGLKLLGKDTTVIKIEKVY